MKIAVLVSGGVDSSVALHLLKQQGHDLTAFYLKIWLEDELSYLGDCPWEEDLAYAREVCQQVGVPLEVISMQKEYWNNVVQYTLAEVKAGRTPNPDIMCNARIKFGQFYDRIDDSFEKVATGHYARIEAGRVENAEPSSGVFYLKMSPDSVKDQTYFLAHLRQNQLARALFPIGGYAKDEVRELAQKFKLPNQDRKDSQGICFLGKIKFADFIGHHLGEKTGDLIEFESGEKVGEHKGFWYYTVGQRQGLGLSGGPWFVVKKDVEANVIYISKDYHSEDKMRDQFEVSDFNWISGYKPPLEESIALKVKVRHGPQIYEASVTFHGESSARAGGVDENFAGENIATSATVELNESDQGIAAGQFAVFYDGDLCLGCGVMTKFGRS